MPITIDSANYPVIQYVDDTIVVMPVSLVQTEHVKHILTAYASLVGLRINIQKSTLVRINLDTVLTKQLASLLNCTSGDMSWTYLGRPPYLTSDASSHF